MKRSISIILLVALVFSISTGCSSQGTPEKTTSQQTSMQEVTSTETVVGDTVSRDISDNIRFATLSMGSSWYTYGATMSDIIVKNYPKIGIDVLPNSGGVGNLKLLQTGQAEVALGFGYVNKWATEGTAAFEGAEIDNLVGLVGALDNYYIGIVARKSLGITSIQDIIDNEMKIKWMTIETGSAGEYANRQILEAYGITYEDIKAYGGNVEHTDFATIVSMFKDQKADIFAQVITVGHPAMTELSVSSEITFIPLDDKALDYLSKYGYGKGSIPSGSFNGQNNDIQTAHFSTSVVTTTNLSEDTAYAITKSIVENPEALAQGHSALSGFVVESAAVESNINLPFHPGAIKYYKEIGLMD